MVGPWFFILRENIIEAQVRQHAGQRFTLIRPTTSASEHTDEVTAKSSHEVRHGEMWQLIAEEGVILVTVKLLQLAHIH